MTLSVVGKENGKTIQKIKENKNKIKMKNNKSLTETLNEQTV